MKLTRRVVGAMIVLGATLCGASMALAADVAGAKDPLNFKRFEGSEIARFERNNYASYELARSDVNILASYDFEKSEKVEGEIARYIYLVPDGHSALEVFRNYEDMLTEAGFARTFDIGEGTIKSGNYFFGKFYFQGQRDTKYAHEYTPFQDSKNAYYLTAEGATADGRKVTVALLVSESTGMSWVLSGGSGKTRQINADQVVVGLDIITSKAVANKMVLVKADDMAKALADTGKIDLYGIYFDVDKSDIKPESNATLAEIAALLKQDTSLNLEIGGHTDNTGAAEHNMTLSDARAAAVIRALTTTYGIDGSRLQARGYGDTMPIAANTDDAGRAKNRRVALRKL